MDSKIFLGSSKAYRSQLDLESLPQTDVSVEGSDIHHYYPVSKITDTSSVIEINIPSSFTHFIDFSSSILYVRLRILKKDGSNLAATDLVTVSHNAFASLFESLEITMNGTLVSKSASLYPIKTHLVDLLTRSSTYKNSLLSSQLFIPDTVQDTFVSAQNTGFAQRLEFTKLSKFFELSGKICEGISNCPKYFPQDVNTNIIIRRSSPEHVLVSPTVPTAGVINYKLEIDKMYLAVRRYIVSPEILSYHNQLLHSGKNFKYPMRSLQAHTFAISTGSQSVLSECIFRGDLPEWKAVEGDINLSPFNLQHFDLQQASISIDGDKSIFKNIEFNTGDKLILEGFNTLCLALPEGEDHGISRTDYINGNFLVILGISPDNTNAQFQQRKVGNVKVQLSFRTPLIKNIHCVVIGQFQQLLTIDKYKNVSVETI